MVKNEKLTKMLILCTTIFYSTEVLAETILDPATKKTKKPAVIEKSVEAKASSYTVINEKELKDSGQSTVTQVLSQVPGITTSPSFASFRIRGIANMNTSQYTYGRQGNIAWQKDGFLYNPTMLMHMNNGLWDVKNVTVLKGPQPTAISAPALAGAVIIESNKPSFEKNSKKTMIEVGSFGTIKSGLTVNKVFNSRTAVRVSAYVHKSNGDVKHKIPTDTIKHSNGKSDANINGKHGLRTDEKALSIKLTSRLAKGGEFNAIFNKDKSGTNKYKPVSDLQNLTTVQAQQGFAKGDHTSISLGYKTPISKTENIKFKLNHIKSDNKTDYGWFAERYWNEDAVVADDTEGADKFLTYEQSNRDFYLKNLTFSAGYEKQLSKTDKIDVNFVYDKMDMLSEGNYDWDTSMGANRIAFGSSDKSKSYSIYGNYTKQVTAKSTLLMGARFVKDKLNYNGTWSKTAPNLKSTNNTFLPSIALLHTYDKKTILKTAFKTGYTRGGATEANNKFRPYQSEKLTEISFGIEKKLSNKTSFSASIFHNSYKDKQESVDVNETPSAGGAKKDYTYTANVGAGKSKGIEFGVLHTFTNNIYGTFTGAYMKTEYTSGSKKGKEFAGAPKKMFNATLGYDDGKYFGNTNISYRGALISTGTRKNLNASTLINMKVGVKKDNVKYLLGVNNVFNKRRMTHTLTSNVESDTAIYYYTPQISSRYIYIGFELDF